MAHYLTKVEAKSVLASLKRWFKTHPDKTYVKTVLGPVGAFKFHRNTYREKVAGLVR